MRIKHYSILALISIFIFSCSHDSDSTPVAPTKISFAHADGSIISENECINPNSKYVIKIETNSKFTSNKKVKKLDYTVNGTVYSMTLSNNDIQTNPINLVDGDNFAQIVGSDSKCNLKYIDQGDFKLVE
ncbi:hypothetical protein SAMN05444397_12010 [Flavobacterium aquidurense]|uniref:Lipoprotein n=1 Tax=Flavobacterium frigidimaris TaxID=262320 RepID=A0ABX4BJ85_FLAFR|nr:hypothetical protein [Flavobacterium frigidimaris]OXA75334.1 hypothetical protein B0A65_22180 [Flavobacterium frigidimaris]SDZ67443.1 hypothetical protein SAMN05444397_12010 [Flavobacterium aquidurense]